MLLLALLFLAGRGLLYVVALLGIIGFCFGSAFLGWGIGFGWDLIDDCS